jgi:hypothetical protein
MHDTSPAVGAQAVRVLPIRISGTPDKVTASLADLDALAAIPEARILCPVVMETVLGV